MFTIFDVPPLSECHRGIRHAVLANRTKKPRRREARRVSLPFALVKGVGPVSVAPPRKEAA